MEAAAGRGGSLAMPSSQPSRKEWRAVSEHSFQNNGDEDPDHVKLGQSDERTIYEEGTGPLDVDFCAITIDVGGLDGDLLQQRIQDISRQREELQQMETEFRAQVIARSEILEVQNGFDAQIKEYANVAAKLKEQLEEREQHIRELEMKMEEKERELRAVKIDNEAAWAKEDIFREQNKELTTFRRERDDTEAERAQHLKQIHDLQEHIRELEDQHRVAQETIHYKDEQLRAWVTRVQEMDALQSTTNQSIQSLQAELRERTEQFNQYWIGFQRQFVDMERLHLQAIQQLQRELAEAREQNGMYNDDSQLAHASLKESSSYVQNQGNQFNVNESGTANGNPVFVSNGNMDGALSFGSASTASTKTEHVPGVPVVPSSILGMGAFLPPGQMTALHPFVMHPQGVPQSVASTNSHISQSQLGHFQPIPTIPSHQHWQNQQALSEIPVMTNQNQFQPSQVAQNLMRSAALYSYELPAEQVVHSNNLESHSSHHHVSGPIITGSSEEAQVINEKVLDSNAKQNSVSQEPQETLHGNCQFRATLGLDLPMQNSDPKLREEKSAASTNQLQEQVSIMEQPWSADNVSESALSNHSVSSNDVSESNVAAAIMPEVSVSTARAPGSLTSGKALEPTLIDERSLLACIVRAIPSGSSGRIRISTTLPNRLGKMLAPLHWHDYKKQYGKLDDFVALHLELFVIEGDFIHLREGAQEIISATTAAAKVAAAAAASAPYSSLLPSVAVTPVAQSHRQKKVPSTETIPVKTIPRTGIVLRGNTRDSSNKPTQLLTRHNQQPNGVGFNIVQGLSDVKILSKSKNLQELNSLSSEVRFSHSSIHTRVENGTNLDKAALPSSQNKGLSNGRHGIGGKQQGRHIGSGLIARR